MSPDTPARVNTRTKIAYGAPAFALALLGVPVYVHLPKFYSDVLGANLATLGLGILATRVWDAITDPIMGIVSDRTRTRYGRRRPYLFVAPIVLAVAVVWLFAPPADVEGAEASRWFTVSMLVVFLAWTAIQIPHAALGPELTSSFDERTSIFAVRDGLWVAGTLAAAVGPAAARWWLAISLGPGGERETFRLLGWIYAMMLVALPWWCALSLRERRTAHETRPSAPLRLRELWRNRPFRILIGAYAIGALGGGLPATLILYYVEYVLRAKPLADVYLTVYFLSGFLCLPLWTRLSRRLGKKPTWLVAMGISTLAFSGAFLLRRGDTVLYGLVVVFSGMGFGAGLVLPSSMQADTIDYDELRSGERREGLYLGLWSIVTKVSAALGAAVALPLLSAAGYAPGVEQSDRVLLTLRALYCLVPCACYLAAFAVAVRYPIDRSVHARILDGIKARLEGGAVIDPLARS